jgi:hypothetical protein
MCIRIINRTTHVTELLTLPEALARFRKHIEQNHNADVHNIHARADELLFEIAAWFMLDEPDTIRLVGNENYARLKRAAAINRLNRN